MKILIGDNGNVDFERPVAMTAQQQEAFLDMMGSMFKVLHVDQTSLVRDDRLGDKLFSRGWTEEEYELLLHVKDLATVCEELGRSWMSVDIQRGWFVPVFLNWCQRHGVNVVQNPTLARQLIRDFLKEKEVEQQIRKEARAAARRARRDLEQEQAHLEDLEANLRTGIGAMEKRLAEGRPALTDMRKLPASRERLNEVTTRLKQIEEALGDTEGEAGEA